MPTKTEPSANPDMNDDLKPEYTFDYSKARPNRFAAAAHHDDGRLVVVLEPDVARIFTTPEAVNSILRALIQHMPEQTKKAA